jgi:hypothetical protein
MDVGTFLLMLGLSYAFRLFWYDLLPGRLPEQIWRVAAYPLLGIFLAEALLPRLLTFDPAFGGIHVIASIVGSLVGVLADWLITTARRPATIAHPEPVAA